MIPRPFVGKTKPRRGFAAFISVLVISGLALIMSTAAAAAYLNQSHESADRISAIQARASAYSCADIALLRIKQDSEYNGNENVNIGNVNCLIETVIFNGDARTVFAKAAFNGFWSRIKVEIADVNEFFVSSWTEVPS